MKCYTQHERFFFLFSNCYKLAKINQFTHSQMATPAKSLYGEFTNGGFMKIRRLDQGETFSEGFVPETENGKSTINQSSAFPDWPKPKSTTK